MTKPLSKRIERIEGRTIAEPITVVRLVAETGEVIYRKEAQQSKRRFS